MTKKATKSEPKKTTKKVVASKKATPKKASTKKAVATKAVATEVPVEAPVAPFTPKVDEMFLCDGFIAAVKKDGTIVRCSLGNGVVMDSPLPFTSLEGHNCTPLTRGEAIRMLNG